MKQILITIFLCLFFFISYDQRGLSVEGRIKGIKAGTTIYLVNNWKIDTVAKIIAKNENFSFKSINVPSPEWISVRISALNEYPSFLLENTKVNVEGNISDWKNATVKGSIANTEYLEFQDKDDSIKRIRDSLQKLWVQASQTQNTSQATYFQSEVKRLQDMRLDHIEEFIRHHPNSLYTPFLIMNDSRLDYLQKQKEYELLAELVKSSNYGIKLKQQIEMEKIQTTIKIGSRAPNFSSLTTDRTPLTLESVVKESKLTLIDFWASWCLPCRQEIPNQRRVYEEFHEKGFNILSVSFDYRDKAWKDAILKDSMTWFNVSELQGRQETAGLMYSISGIPASMLLDSLGHLISIDAPGSKISDKTHGLRGGNLYKAVATYFGEPNKESKYEIENKKFLENTKTSPRVITMPSGLQYEIVKNGNGEKPRPESTVKVNYSGALVDGKIFANTFNKNEPLTVDLNNTIKAWAEGLPLMQVGSKWRLYVPANLAYGDEGFEMIPPFSTLIFEIELLEVVK
jgi:FKBP-type peptidyl-prolyl cis-trans isomerase